MIAKAIQTDTYITKEKIEEHLKDVEYIILAAPAPEKFRETPIQITIFLNTAERFPKDIQNAILDKFRDENSIKEPYELMSQVMAVGFGLSPGQETPMPLLLIDRNDIESITHKAMFVMDFLADSDNFNEAKFDGLTGWSYSYN